MIRAVTSLHGVRAVTDLIAELAPIIAQASQQVGIRATITRAQRLSGGAINQNFLLELTDAQGGLLKWVLRRGQSLPIPGSLNRAAEFAMVAHAHGLGLMVPRPIALIEAEGVSASVFEWRPGKTDGRALVAWLTPSASAHASQTPKAESNIAALEEISAITQSLGMQLGLLHGDQSSEIAANTLSSHLGPQPTNGFAASIDLLKSSFARVKRPKRYLTAAYQACLKESEVIAKSRQGAIEAACVSHNDFRLGNLMIDPEQAALTAVLDWEFTAWGDPMADIGWLTAPCWRFGGQQQVAGFGSIEDLMQGYARATTDPKAISRITERVEHELDFWQRYAHLRWAIIAAQQGERAVSGDTEALELLLTGAMVASILQPTLKHYWGTLDQVSLSEPQGEQAELDRLLAETGLHLKSHLAMHLTGAQRYSALMSANAIRLARGELRAPTGPGLSPSAPSGTEATITPEFERQARSDLARDLAISNFRG